MIYVKGNNVTIKGSSDKEMICEAGAALAAVLEHLVQRGDMAEKIPNADRMMYLEQIISIANLNHLSDHSCVVMEIPEGKEDLLPDTEEDEEGDCEEGE